MPADVLPETLILGGGIGGLSAALSLALRGAAVTVLERSKSFAEVGAGIQLAPNAIRILRQLDVLDEIMPNAVMPRRLVLADAVEGRELTSLDLTDFPARYGAPYLVLHRGDLLSALLGACVASGVRLHTDASVVELTDTGTATVAACADGREFTAQVAIGADGLHSRIRKYFADDEPILSGFVAYRGAVPMEQVERHADLRDVVAWLGPGLHLVQYPLRSGRMYNQVAVFRSEALLRGDPGWGGPAELTAAFAGCCEHVRESLSTLSIDNRWPMLDRLPTWDWAQGRVALLGDAAHPMLQYLAQGACQALEDSAVLAAELAAAAAAGRPYSDGLARYAAVRAPRAARVQRTARTWGEIWHVGGVAKLIRDELLLTRDVADHRHVSWLFGEEGHTTTDVAHQARDSLLSGLRAGPGRPHWQEFPAEGHVEHDGGTQVSSRETIGDGYPAADLADVGGPACGATEVGDGQHHEHYERQRERRESGQADAGRANREHRREQGPHNQPRGEGVVEGEGTCGSDDGDSEELQYQGGGEQESRVAHAESAAEQLPAAILPESADEQPPSADAEARGDEDVIRGARQDPALD